MNEKIKNVAIVFGTVAGLSAAFAGATALIGVNTTCRLMNEVPFVLGGSVLLGRAGLVMVENIRHQSARNSPSP